MLNLGLEGANHDFVSLALFEQLLLIVVAEADLIALVGKKSRIGVVVLAEDEFAGVLEVFNELITHLRGIENRGKRVDSGIESAVADIFDIDDLLEILADVQLIEGRRIDFGAKVVDAVHQLLGDDVVALALGIVDVVGSMVLNLVHPGEDDFAVRHFLETLVDALVLDLLDFLVDLVHVVLGKEILDQVLDGRLILEDRADEFGVKDVY